MMEANILQLLLGGKVLVTEIRSSNEQMRCWLGVYPRCPKELSDRSMQSVSSKWIAL